MDNNIYHLVTLKPTNIESVKDQINNLQCYPNPTINEVTISLLIENPAKLNFEIVDISGRVCKTFNYSVDYADYHKYKISLSDLSNGFYLLRVKINGNIVGAEEIIKNTTE
jgi:hypothetical protein